MAGVLSGQGRLVMLAGEPGIGKTRLAQVQPLLLVLDDLHWADRSSLLLLEFLAREIDSNPLLILGTYRDVEVSRRHPLSETLGGLVRSVTFSAFNSLDWPNPK